MGFLDEVGDVLGTGVRYLGKPKGAIAGAVNYMSGNDKAQRQWMKNYAQDRRLGIAGTPEDDARYSFLRQELGDDDESDLWGAIKGGFNETTSFSEFQQMGEKDGKGGLSFDYGADDMAKGLLLDIFADPVNLAGPGLGAVGKAASSGSALNRAMQGAGTLGKIDEAANLGKVGRAGQIGRRAIGATSMAGGDPALAAMLFAGMGPVEKGAAKVLGAMGRGRKAVGSVDGDAVNATTAREALAGPATENVDMEDVAELPRNLGQNIRVGGRGNARERLIAALEGGDRLGAANVLDKNKQFLNDPEILRRLREAAPGQEAHFDQLLAEANTNNQNIANAFRAQVGMPPKNYNTPAAASPSPVGGSPLANAQASGATGISPEDVSNYIRRLGEPEPTPGMPSKRRIPAPSEVNAARLDEELAQAATQAERAQIYAKYINADKGYERLTGSNQVDLADLPGIRARMGETGGNFGDELPALANVQGEQQIPDFFPAPPAAPGFATDPEIPVPIWNPTSNRAQLTQRDVGPRQKSLRQLTHANDPRWPKTPATPEQIDQLTGGQFGPQMDEARFNEFMRDYLGRTGYNRPGTGDPRGMLIPEARRYPKGVGNVRNSPQPPTPRAPDPVVEPELPEEMYLPPEAPVAPPAPKPKVTRAAVVAPPTVPDDPIARLKAAAGISNPTPIDDLSARMTANGGSLTGDQLSPKEKMAAILSSSQVPDTGIINTTGDVTPEELANYEQIMQGAPVAKEGQILGQAANVPDPNDPIVGEILMSKKWKNQAEYRDALQSELNIPYKDARDLASRTFSMRNAAPVQAMYPSQKVAAEAAVAPEQSPAEKLQALMDKLSGGKAKGVDPEAGAINPGQAWNDIKSRFSRGPKAPPQLPEPPEGLIPGSIQPISGPVGTPNDQAEVRQSFARLLGEDDPTPVGSGPFDWEQIEPGGAKGLLKEWIHQLRYNDRGAIRIPGPGEDPDLDELMGRTAPKSGLNDLRNMITGEGRRGVDWDAFDPDAPNRALPPERNNMGMDASIARELEKTKPYTLEGFLDDEIGKFNYQRIVPGVEPANLREMLTQEMLGNGINVADKREVERWVQDNAYRYIPTASRPTPSTPQYADPRLNQVNLSPEELQKFVTGMQLPVPPRPWQPTGNPLQGGGYAANPLTLPKFELEQNQAALGNRRPAAPGDYADVSQNMAINMAGGYASGDLPNEVLDSLIAQHAPDITDRELAEIIGSGAAQSEAFFVEALRNLLRTDNKFNNGNFLM